MDNLSKTKLIVNPVVDLKSDIAAQKILESLINNRFIIVRHHDINLKILKNIYSDWLNFFKSDEKLKLLRSDITDEGYVPTEKEKAIGSEDADWKEYYQTHLKGHYPDFINCHFTKVFLNKVVEIANNIISLIDQAMPAYIKNKMTLPLPEMIFGSDRHGFRLIHYPLMNALSTLPRAAAHTDICFFTALPRATEEGLELQDSCGDWHIPIIEDEDILFFSGDMLEIATHGYIGAAIHKVEAKDNSMRKNPRFSFPIFIHPRREIELKQGLTAMDVLRKRITEVGFNGDLLKY